MVRSEHGKDHGHCFLVPILAILITSYKIRVYLRSIYSVETMEQLVWCSVHIFGGDNGTVSVV